MKFLISACIYTGLFFTSIPAQGLAIFQGPTNEELTSFNILVPTKADLKFEIKFGEKLLKFKKQVHDLNPVEDWKVVKVSVGSLNARNKYELNVYAKNKLIDQRFFKSYDIKNKEAKILIASCLDSSYKNIQKKTWESVKNQDVDAIFLIGDNIYADKFPWYDLFKKMSKERLVQRNIESRNSLELYQLKFLVPIYAIWDDHDYGMNDEGRYFELREFSQQLFHKLWNQSDSGFINSGPGVSYWVDMYGVRYFFLDGRSFRETKNTAGEHLGEKQLAWIKQNIPLKETVAFIKGDQFYGGYHPFESYQGRHPQELLKFEKLLRDISNSFFLISGDRHLTEIIDLSKTGLGLKSYEVTSSGAHAKLYPGTMKKYLNPAQLVGRDGTYNFSTLEFRSKNSKKLWVKSFNEVGNNLYEASLDLSR